MYKNIESKAARDLATQLTWLVIVTMVVLSLLFLASSLFPELSESDQTRADERELALREQGFWYEAEFYRYPSPASVSGICHSREHVLVDDEMRVIDKPSVGKRVYLFCK